ncbi:MAG: TetR/AcrR family transcriptional regulator [Clostridiales bacterium]|nr:TetR/AcrR family transcriptional regulator [Clostridiales bacterium]
MTQILKESVRQRIISEAVNQFNETGYIQSKMKDIAIRAGVSVGNIYRYFDNKEDLFESIVQPVIEKINEIFNEMQKYTPNYEMTKESATTFINIYLQYQDIFVLVLENSSNTRFETMKNDIIENFTQIVLSFPVIAKEISQNKQFLFYVKAFSVAFVNGVISILKESCSIEEKIEQVTFFLDNMRNMLISSCEKDKDNGKIIK